MTKDLQIIKKLQNKLGFDNVKYYTVGYDYLTVELQIGYAEIHREDLKLITELTNLMVLKIAYSKINTKIEGLEKLTSLGWLAIVYSQVSKIEGLEGLTNLQDLDLFNNNISKIEGLDNLTKLNILDLRNNQIDTIQGLDNLNNLKGLGISNNNIPEKEIKEFQAKYPKIKVL